MDEVNKLLAASFIHEVYDSDWLANVILVKKVNGKWRMYVDFIDLNKACTKDNFPLPDKNGKERPGEDCLHHKPRALLL